MLAVKFIMGVVGLIVLVGTASAVFITDVSPPTFANRFECHSHGHLFVVDHTLQKAVHVVEFGVSVKFECPDNIYEVLNL